MNATNDHCIALYPGAFRPPHADHFEVVRRLAERPDVDQVVVIVSNRHRDVPGTTKVLGVKLACEIWSIYLRGLLKVSVEIAPQSAIRHALARIECAHAGSHYLMVVGEKDFSRRRSRFEYFENRQGAARATLLRGATNVANVSATELREALAVGEPARAGFCDALPMHLSSNEKQQVWAMCRGAMRERNDTRSVFIMEWLREQGVGAALCVEPVRSSKRDEVYRVKMHDGSRVYVKTANDTLSAARIGEATGPKPRARLKVEYAALKFIRTNVADSVDIPRVLYFERATRTIAFAELCPGGNSLEDDLRLGQFERSVARRLAGFLADCHEARPAPAPFRDTPAGDLEHWREVLRIATTVDDAARDVASLGTALEQLRHASDTARVAGLVHLDLTPKNVLVKSHDIGVLDFELAASVGDPAFDAGLLLGAYLLAGRSSGHSARCRSAIEAFVLCYATGVHGRWYAMSGRIMRFAGTAMLQDVFAEDRPSVDREKVISHARFLLAQAEAEPLMCVDRLCELLP